MIHTSKFSEAWKVQPIGEVCTSIVPGRNKPDFSVAGEYPWLTIDDLQQFYLYNSKLGYRVSKAALDRANGKTVPNNSVIMSCVGQFGIVGIAKTELVINQQLHAFICPLEIDSYFLAMALIWQKPYMERIATKTTVSYMNKAACESIPIPVPPLPEQHKIAEILSTWDEAIDLTEQLIVAKQRRKQALMQRLLTGQDRFPGFENLPLQLISLENCIELGSGKTKPEDTQDAPTLEQSIPVYGGNGVLGYSSQIFVSGKRIIIGRVGEYCGTVRFVDQPCWITDNALYTKKFSDSVYPEYMGYLLSHLNLGRLRKKGGQPLISQKPIYSLKVSLPCISEQTRIAEILNTSDEELALHQQKLTALRRQKQGLMQQLLTGRLRVKV